MTSARHSSNIVMFITMFITLAIVCVNSFPTSSQLQSKLVNHNTHGIRLQPELDSINLEAYLLNSKAINLQIKCLIHDGPCDYVGRFLRPRIAGAILGECIMCTEHQREVMPRIMEFIQTKFPEQFKLGIKKYLLDFGIEIPGSSSSEIEEKEESEDGESNRNESVTVNSIINLQNNEEESITQLPEVLKVGLSNTTVTTLS